MPIQSNLVLFKFQIIHCALKEMKKKDDFIHKTQELLGPQGGH